MELVRDRRRRKGGNSIQNRAACKTPSLFCPPLSLSLSLLYSSPTWAQAHISLQMHYIHIVIIISLYQNAKFFLNRMCMKEIWRKNWTTHRSKMYTINGKNKHGHPKSIIKISHKSQKGEEELDFGGKITLTF